MSANKKGMNVVAFFDLDKTLICKNSGTLWVISEAKGGHISLFNAARATTWLIRYRLGYVDLKEGVEIAIKSLEGTKESDLKERITRFYQNEVRDLVRPGAKAAIEEHRRANDRVVLLTSASNYLSELVVKELALDGFIANRFEVNEQGIFTGQPRGEICYGSGKLTLARAFLKGSDVSLQDCAFYTDSMADLPVMEEVGRPVAINPDPRLRRLALKRGWPVEDWGSPVT